ncbi:MAG: 3-phosphoshikimate 1-carboxyvinyltransferase [Phycisphaerales bacterium]
MAARETDQKSMQAYLDVLRTPIDALPNELQILPIHQSHFRTISVQPPGSKSLTNRALLLAALADGSSTVANALIDADDTQRMLGALQTLGVQTRITGTTASVQGIGGMFRVEPPGAELDLGNAGTATRFLAAASLLSKWPTTITGDARMRERPIGGLVDALEQLGAKVEFLASPFCPPIRITAPAPLPRAATVHLGTLVSSQFISALLLIGPFLPGGITIQLKETPPSEPYIRMTLGMLDQLGVSTRASADLRVLRVAEHALSDLAFDIEPDASGASYFLGAGALLQNATVRIPGLSAHSLQGDVACAEVLSQMGATLGRSTAKDAAYTAIQSSGELKGIDVDLADMPDIAMTIASVACFAKGTSTLRGLGTLRVKETDRIHAIQTELRKVGVGVEEIGADRDALRVTPPANGIDCSADAPLVAFDTYNDHRMAMSLALIGLRRPNVVIRDPACVRKTYPTFWRDFSLLYTS